MARSKRKSRKGSNGHRSGQLPEGMTLRTANLDAPMFQESWDAGSPLNWVEFVQRWEAKRDRRKSRRTAG